ncbi:MAG: Ku protein, partial [Mycobacteriales bacterium]
VFVLETMLWPDEVRTPDFGFLDEDIEVRDQELKMAASLIETLSGDFDASEYKDSYRDALNAVIEAKIAGREVVAPEAAQPTSGTVVDLMAALRASVDAAKKNRADAATGKDAASAKKAPAKKAPSTRAPAKKPAPGQGKGGTTAKKTASTKPRAVRKSA